MTVFQKIEQYLAENPSLPLNIVISGMTCSGKTTLAKRLVEHFSKRYRVSIISQDDYYKNLEDIPRTPRGYLTDSLYAFHTEEFCRDVGYLLRNGEVKMPKYDVASNTRISKDKLVNCGEINIFEGLNTIHLLRGLKNSICFYIDMDDETCLARRIERDSRAFGVKEVRIREFWNDCIYPMSKRYIINQKEKADFIIKNEGWDI